MKSWAEALNASAWNLVALDEVQAAPWRNGGGVTRELVAWPDAVRWRWRLSVADIGADGPFSCFEGVTRWFAVLEGQGVRLDVAGQLHRLDASSPPLCFDGGSPTGCWLQAGPTRDFNLMSRGAAQMRRVCGTAQGMVPQGRAVAVYSHAGPARIVTDAHPDAAGRTAPQEVFELPARTLAWRADAQPLGWQFQGEDALWMEMTL